MKPFTLKQAILESALAVAIAMAAALVMTGCASTQHEIAMQRQCAKGAVRRVCVNPHSGTVHECFACENADVMAEPK